MNKRASIFSQPPSYVRIELTTELDRDSKTKQLQAMQQLYQRGATQGFLIDSRTVSCTALPEPTTEYVHQDMADLRMDPSLPIAILHAEVDQSYQHFVSECQGAGYAIQGFDEEAHAIAWLKREPSPASTPSLRVLILDDQAADRDLLRILLEDLIPEIEIVEFDQPEAAIAFLEAEAPNLDLMLVDRRMPTMDGTEWLERILSIIPDQVAPCYLMSSSLRKKEIASAQAIGFAGIVEKVFSLSGLEQELLRIPELRDAHERSER
ncbi:MAG: response regulator [Bacteroidota bacterium]